MRELRIKSAIEGGHERNARFCNHCGAFCGALGRQVDWFFTEDRLARPRQLVDLVVMQRRGRGDDDSVDVCRSDDIFGGAHLCAEFLRQRFGGCGYEISDCGKPGAGHPREA